jgi:hypothetical protein
MQKKKKGLVKVKVGFIRKAPSHEDVWESGNIVPSFLTTTLHGGEN